MEFFVIILKYQSLALVFGIKYHSQDITILSSFKALLRGLLENFFRVDWF